MNYSALDVARYFLMSDESNTIFTDELISKNDRNFYKGNALLNKYLFFAQTLYFVKHQKLLFSDNIYAYDNGPVVESVRTNYSILKATMETFDPSILKLEDRTFLNKIFLFLKNASINELIDITHKDKNWIEKKDYFQKENQIMDIENNYAYYSDLYEDSLYLMEKM